MMKNEVSIDKALLPKEMTIMLHLLNKGEVMVDTEMNWKLFIELAKHHRIYPVLHQIIKQTKDHNCSIPIFVIDRISLEYKRNIYQMLRLSGEMEVVSKVLNDNHIPSIILKGPVLAVDLYGDLSLRTSCDLDILVPIKDLEQTKLHLLSSGYEMDDYIQKVLGDWKWRHHHITFTHPVKGIKLEVHWRMNPGPSREPGFQELWNRKRESTITKYPVYYLGREDLFLFLVMHGARHGWSRLRWLMDIDKISKQDIKWMDLKKILQRYGYLHTGGQALILASSLFLTPISADMKLIINGSRSKKLAQAAMFYVKQMVNLHSEPLPIHISKFHKKHLFSLMSVDQKMLFMLSFLYPYPEDVKTLPLPRKLHFLYFALRPFLWIWRKTRNHALSWGGNK